MRLNVRLDLIMDEIEVAKEGADLVGKDAGEKWVGEGVLCVEWDRESEIELMMRENSRERGCGVELSWVE